MTNLLTDEEMVLVRFKKVHGDKYNYNKVRYINKDTPVEIICPIHGSFFQKPSVHINGSGCRQCGIDSQKISKEEIIKRFKKVHGDKYDYNKVYYINKDTPVEIICSKHGSFFQKPNNHLNGSNCPKCAKENTWKLKKPRIKYNQEMFIKECLSKFPNINYSKTKYSKMTNKCIFSCSEHGEFEQRAETHLKSKFGCPKCAKEIKRFTNEDFIKKAKNIHGNKYDYSATEYFGTAKKIKINCKKHGVFEQTPGNHIFLKQGCPKCANERWLEKNKNEFALKAEKVNPDKYDYSKVAYVNYKEPVEIICKKHGSFLKTPNKILKGIGCPKCSQEQTQSRGAGKVQKFLEENNINFIPEYRFEDCKNINSLPFDFYLPEKNILIEYDGQQHFNSIEYFGGEEALEKTQRNDNIKTEYALKNKLNLIRIPYTEIENIENILKENLWQ